jgi:uncharacterized protein (TIGR03435 family)
VKTAAVKHRVWTAVMLLMLVLPVWTASWPKIPLRFLPSSTGKFVDQALVLAVTIPSVPPLPDVASSRKFSEPKRSVQPKWQVVLLGVYFFGVLSLFLRLALGTAKAHRLVRHAVLRAGKLTSASCAAPITVGLLHPSVILPESWPQWPHARLEAVLFHESEHVRRRDPLVQWLALLNRAVFWFHPASWWLERQLCSLAEEACDVAVLARGFDPREYAETLIEMARSVMHSRARVNIVGMAMPGGFLPQRIRQIIEGNPAPLISRARLACLVGALTISCTVFAFGALEHSLQLSSAAVPERPTFDTVSIRSTKPGEGGSNMRWQPGNFFRANTSVRALIAVAYFGEFNKTRLVVGGPDWLDSEAFHIEARPKGSPVNEERKQLEQSLLADRFKLVVHHETQQLPIYALTLSNSGKIGPQLEPHSTDAKCTDTTTGKVLSQPRLDEPMPAYCEGFFMNPRPGDLRTTGNQITMDMLGAYFFQFLDRPVMNRTGLGGFFDFNLEFAPSMGPGSQPDANGKAAGPSAQPSLFTAVQEKLGLELVPQTGAVDVLVIDHVEEPLEN